MLSVGFPGFRKKNVSQQQVTVGTSLSPLKWVAFCPCKGKAAECSKILGPLHSFPAVNDWRQAVSITVYF